MKIKILFGALFFASALVGYTATPNEFPGAFVKQAQTGIDAVIEEIKDLDALSSIMVPIAAMNNSASLNTVRNNLAELERMTMSEGSSTQMDAIRLAGLYKLSVPLILKMNDRILEMLSQIETVLSFWKDAQEYRVRFFLHRKSPKVIIHNLQRIQDELCTLFGALVQHVDKVPFGQDRELQYAWLKELYAFLNNQEASAKVVMTQPVFESVAAMLTRAISFVLAFNSQMEKRLYEYGKPSWIRRNFGLATTLVGGGAALAVSAEKCKDANGDRYIKKAANTVVDHANMYRKACADAIWGNDKRWEEKIKNTEAEEKVSFKTKASRLLPVFARDEQHRDELAEQLVRQRLVDLGMTHGKTIDLSEVIFDENGALIKDMQKSDATAAAEDTPVRRGSDSDASASAAAVDSDLKRIYCHLFGMRDLPMPKPCAQQLLALKPKAFTVEAMNNAAETRDLLYLLGLPIQPIAAEGGDLAQGIADIPTILQDTELKEETLVRNILAGAAAGTRLSSFLPAPTPSAKKYQSPGGGVEAIAKNMDGRLGLLDTIAQMPDVGYLGIQIFLTKVERKQFEYQKKFKLLGMLGISYFLYRVGKDIIAPPIKWMLEKTRIISYPYEGLFDTLRELKKLLLVNGEKQQSEMDPYDVGLMYYLIHRLECVHVPAKYSATFLDDVRLLQSPDLSAKQKYKVVKDVLQGGYPFLRPVGVTTK